MILFQANLWKFCLQNVGHFVEAINVLKLWAHLFSFGKAHTPYTPPYCSLIPLYWYHKGDWKVKWLDNNYKCPEITEYTNMAILETPHTAQFNITQYCVWLNNSNRNTLFSSLLMLMKMKTSKPYITGVLWGGPGPLSPVDSFCKRSVMQNVFPCDDIMLVELLSNCHEYFEENKISLFCAEICWEIWRQ